MGKPTVTEEPSVIRRPFRFFLEAAVRWFMFLFVIAVAHIYWPVGLDEEMRTQVEEMRARHRGAYNADKPVIAVDYTQPVYRKRLWMVDPDTGKVLLNCHVGHAWRSGMIWAQDFSNTPNTQKSSFGAFVAKNSYDGQFGYAMRIVGLDRDVNDNVLDRAIVFHGSEIPWSAGCFVTPPAYNKRIIDTARNGALIVVKASEFDEENSPAQQTAKAAK